MDLCLIGSRRARAHQGYVADGIENIPDINITGISTGTDEDIPEELVKMSRSSKHKDFKYYSDWRLMLKTLKPDIVSIAGPFEKRAEMCVEAFKNCIHLFCEKPVALGLQELEKMKKSAQRVKGTLRPYDGNKVSAKLLHRLAISQKRRDRRNPINQRTEILQIGFKT